MRKSKSRGLRLDLTGFHPALAQLVADAFTLCAPPPDLTVSEWSDEFRYLSRKDSAEPGKWKTSRAEYGRGIMDAYTEPGVAEIVVAKATQVGWTAILGNIVGYHIHLDPCPMILMQPTVNLAKAWSKDRLAPMLDETPVLKGQVASPRSRDSGNTILHKEFAGGHLTIIGANAPSEIASRPVRLGLCDETERYPVSAGSEGDPMKLLAKRLETFWNRKQLKGSTPKLKGGPILRDYERSDKRMFFVPCPNAKCGERQTLKWEQVKWDKTEDGEHLPETAHYQCEHCGHLWDDAERNEAVSKGEWRATAPFRGVAGFFLPKFYSPFIKLHEVVEEFLAARRDPHLMQVFVNTVLAEGWEEQGETVEKETLESRAELYGPDDLPDGVVFATLGVDVQGNRLECQTLGFGVGEEIWSVAFDVLHGDPAQPEVWDELDELRKRRFYTRDGRIVRIRGVAVDAGGHHADAVHRFCRTRWKQKIFAINGQGGARPIWPVRSSRAGHKGKDKVMTVGVDTAKDVVYGRLKITLDDDHEDGKPKAGYIHFPSDPELGFDAEYFKQLTSEQAVTRYRMGKPYRVYVKKKGHERNEALDTFVYAICVRQAVKISLKSEMSVRRYLQRRAQDAATQKVAAATAHAVDGDPETVPPPDAQKVPARKRKRTGFNRTGRSWLGR